MTDSRRNGESSMILGSLNIARKMFSKKLREDTHG
jgi:hypothetical protein